MTDSMIQGKIYQNPRYLVPKIEKHRKNGEKIVFGNGCFDILHVGHTRYLNAAKALGSVLIVAVNTDESMRRIKNNREPVTPFNERLEIIAAIGAVDYVVPLEEDNPISLIKLFRPEIHTKGRDYEYEKKEIPERDTVEGYGGHVRTVGWAEDHSTTEILRYIKNR